MLEHVKLTSLMPSPIAAKKWRAHWSNGRHTDFGSSAHQDYTMHKDKLRRARYLARHSAREDWADPFTPGALSRWLLWNKPTLAASLADFRRRFKV
jgi:hypothetical protein